MQDNVWLSVTGLGISIKSISSNSDYNTYQNFEKMKNSDNIEWQLHNNISDAGVLGCRHNHKILIMT